MSFEDIPEDKEESFPCECGGDITVINGEWICSKCDFKKRDKRSDKNEKSEKR